MRGCGNRYPAQQKRRDIGRGQGVCLGIRPNAIAQAEPPARSLDFLLPRVVRKVKGVAFYFKGVGKPLCKYNAAASDAEFVKLVVA